MKYSNLIISTVLVFSLSGCNDKDLFKDKTQEQPGTQVKSLTFDTISIQVNPNDEPNKYTLLVRWPKDSGSVKILDGTELLFQGTNKINFFAKEVIGGQTLDVDLQQQSLGEEYESIYKRKIKVPLDFVLTNKTNLTADFSFEGGRFFILNSAFMQTNTFNVNIDVDEFISENGTFETFPYIKKTYETAGESGGNILITARSAKGKLTANMRGVNGGVGRDSWCWPQFRMYCSASNGGRGGDAGYFTIKALDGNSLEIVKNIQKGVGGRAGIACVYNNQSPLGSYMIYGYESNCEGYGKVGSNGIAGENGNGKICTSLSSEAVNECI